jgi:PAS domain S-box-containing protein
MRTSPSIGRPEIQAELISEALYSASVGFLVWDEDRRYVAANAAACEILGATLEELLGQDIEAHTAAGLDGGALTSEFSSGETVVQRFDGRRPVEVFFATFPTKTAGMPFMATVISPMS